MVAKAHRWGQRAQACDVKRSLLDLSCEETLDLEHSLDYTCFHESSTFLGVDSDHFTVNVPLQHEAGEARLGFPWRR